jgi:hypothetical protein
LVAWGLIQKATWFIIGSSQKEETFGNGAKDSFWLKF